MKKFLFLFFSFFIGLTSFSQPGYLGKKLLLSYNSYPGIAFKNPTYNNMISWKQEDKSSDLYYGKETYSKESKQFGLNLTHDLTLEYVTSRTVSWNISTRYKRTSIEHQTQVNINSHIVDLYDPNALNFKLHSYEFAIYRKKYLARSAGVAPLGMYFSIGVSYYHNAIYYQENIDIETIQEDLIHTFSSYSIGAEIGKKFIFKDLFFLDISLSHKILLIPNTLSYSNNYSTNSNNQQQLEHNAKRRLFNLEFINLKIGLGILIN